MTSMVVNPAEDELNEMDPGRDCSLTEAISTANDTMEVDACKAGNDTEQDVIAFTLMEARVRKPVEAALVLSDGGTMVTLDPAKPLKTKAVYMATDKGGEDMGIDLRQPAAKNVSRFFAIGRTRS